MRNLSLTNTAKPEDVPAVAEFYTAAGVVWIRPDATAADGALRLTRDDAAALHYALGRFLTLSLDGGAPPPVLPCPAHLAHWGGASIHERRRTA